MPTELVGVRITRSVGLLSKACPFFLCPTMSDREHSLRHIWEENMASGFGQNFSARVLLEKSK